MEHIFIHGIPILFPYRPYRSQLLLMNRIIASLKSSENCLLESPTGTGKTLAILCSCLAWQRMEMQKSPENPNDVPIIFYGTRTHKQIAQLIQQLKLTDYCNKIQMSILSSRQHTCIHPDVSKSSTKNEDCKRLSKSTFSAQKCSFNNIKIKTHSDLYNARRHFKTPDFKVNDAFDIEDLVKVGRSRHTCPYYLSRHLAGQSKLIFCPYNFLIDPRVLASAELNLDNCIIILDEAHNIDDNARESLSFQINKLHLEELVLELYSLIRRDTETSENQSNLTVDVRTAISFLMPRLDALSHWIDSHQLKPIDIKKRLLLLPIMEVLLDLSKLGLGPDVISKCRTHLSVLTNSQVDSDESTDYDTIQWISDRVRFVADEIMLALETIYSDSMKFIDDYNIVLQKETDSFLTPDESAIQLKFICNNAAVAFHQLTGKFRSLLVCSGTLAPLHSFSAELGIKFQHTIEADHIINSNQVNVNVLGQGPHGHVLRCTFKNCETFRFQDELGQSLLCIEKAVCNGGILIFVSSYRLLNTLIQRWTSTGLWEKLSNRRSLFSEKSPDPLFLVEQHEHLVSVGRRPKKDVIEIYREAAKIEFGAILFGVFRGRISEGLDFADDTARCIVTVGLPYPNLKEITVELKRKYNDIRRVKSTDSKDLISGDEWYDTQAFRALNQALGRCIRHRNDWGSLILIDDRFKPESIHMKHISKWLRSQMTFYRNYSIFISNLSTFHNDMNEKCKNVNNDESAKSKQPKRYSEMPIKQLKNSVDMNRSLIDMSKSKMITAERRSRSNILEKHIVFKKPKNDSPPLIDLSNKDVIVFDGQCTTDCKNDDDCVIIPAECDDDKDFI